ncbi:stage 0 sporulation protein [bacterium]|nr:stage 0 sporulation protein [bacterium]
MPKVVGVVFEGNNKKYYFGAITNLNPKDKVVVETARGLEVGTIVEGEKTIDDSEVIGELKMVQRKATLKDLEIFEENNSIKPRLYDEVKSIIERSELEMKLLEVSYTLDRTKLVVYFSADGRIDFRELVKDIASVYKTRIELRQVGPRDASRIISGLGICGREVCCSSFLGEMQNVTIKMAKNQNLSLNPTAISGLCGKLLCCIAYEEDQYEDIQKLHNGEIEEFKDLEA